MKLQLISDIHIEFHKDRGRSFADKLPVVGDYLVIAGDLGLLSYPIDIHNFLKRVVPRYEHTVYVLGNHEYYGILPDEATVTAEELEEAFEHKLTVAGQKGVIRPLGPAHDDRRIVAGTMWFPDDPLNVVHSGQMTDFHAIKGFVPWVYETNAKFQGFLDRNLREGDIVVTHHLPSYGSVNDMFKGSSLNRFFVCDMGPLVADAKPAIWLHGHTHCPADYLMWDTRVVCNPLGYIHAESPAFNDSLAIEV